MRRVIFIIGLLVVLTMIFSGCAGGATPAPAPEQPAAAPATEEAATEAPAAEGKPLKIALSIPGLSFPFFVFMEKQVRAEAEALGNIEIVTLDGQNQVPKQTADLEAVIAQGYDGLLISPITTEGMAPAVQQVVDAGIPVVTIDRSISGVDVLAHVGADNVLGGEAQGQAILELFPDGATIFELLGTPGASPAIDRDQGLKNVIGGVENITIACEQTAQFTRDQGLSVTENCLGSTSNPDAIVAANDDMGLGAVQAAQAAGLQIPIISYDALPEALQAVQAGDLYGTVEQFPGEQSKTALRTLVDKLRNGTDPESKAIYITPKLITKDNINEAERLDEIGGAPAAAAPAAEGQPLKIALSIPGLSFPFFVFMEKQVRAEAEALGNIEIVTLDGQNQVPKQTADMEAVIAQEYDGVLISPITTEGMAPAVQQVVDAGIPVVTIDRSISGVDVLAHVGADNVKGGEAQGEALLQLFPDGATIFELLGTPGASPAIDRDQGLKNVIGGVENITIACEQTAQFTRDQGLSVTENCLGSTPNPDAIVAANDDMGLGAVQAAQAAGLQIPIISYDALPEALQAVQAGDLYGTVEQFPGEQSKTALRTLVDKLRNGTDPESKAIYITPKLITKDNINEAERLDEIGGAPAPAEEEAMAGEKGTIVFIPKSTDVSYWLFVKKGVEDAAAELGYSTDYQGVPRETDIAQQADLVRNIITTKPAGIVMAATDTQALIPPVEEAIAAGIPLVTVDSGVDFDAPLTYIATDNVAGAADGARWLAEAIGGQGKVGNLGILAGSQTGRERDEGFLDTIGAEYPDIEVVPTQFTGCDPSKAINAATDILTANPDLVGFYSACGPNGLGIAQAVKAAGLEDQVTIITFDPNPEVIPLFEDGTIEAMIAQDPYQMGYQGVYAIDTVVNGGTIAEKETLIPVTIITQENYSDPAVQKLMNP